MSNAAPFPGLGLPENLVPHPPADIPAPQTAGDAVASLSPFTGPQDVASIIAQLVLDRPLKLFIPDRHLYPDHEFHIINSSAVEKAAAHNKGFREVTDPKLAALFTDLVAGSDKDGKTLRPILMARPKAVGDVIRKRQRQQLASLYAGMDPANKELGGKYTAGVDSKDGTFLKRDGTPWRIRVE